MTGQPTRKGKCISHGWARDDDPIYTNAGWNFLIGKNLAPDPPEELWSKEELQGRAAAVGERLRKQR